MKVTVESLREKLASLNGNDSINGKYQFEAYTMLLNILEPVNNSIELYGSAYVHFSNRGPKLLDPTKVTLHYITPKCDPWCTCSKCLRNK